MRWLAFLAALAATEASALSCLPPDPVRTFLKVDAAPERWGAAVGRLDFDASRLPQSHKDSADTPPETWLRGQLVGHTLDTDGWTKPFQGSVALKVLCYGPWCAQPKSGRTYLLFLQREPHRHVATADPCGAYIFANPSREDLDRVFQCFAGGPCEPRQP
ncbi:hypothetical protein [Sagittula salina]|uniref:Uncharacterized protein n=1 Tax=Sagittula salina TaxID=2820268 RepID=A0A940MNA4_9RHOB|nr:hypothetical protein [Sagittula salina]MBP0482424.1 hypothetical protein [Sagittula salina]